MLYTQTIYNLLNIPDTVDEPTAYDLLGLAPFGLTPERVDEAVKKQQHQAFMRLPDPAYVPMLLRLAKDLERASELLSDEHKRKEHDDYISDQLSKSHDPAHAKRSQAMIEARKGLDMLVRRDIVLAEEARPRVMDKIISIGLGEKDVRRLLNQVPKPAPFIPNLRNSIVDYYVMMVNLSRSLGSFESDQTRLKEIGTGMLMFPGTATDQIMQQATQADVTQQSVEMALEVNGGYVVDSAVDVDHAAGMGYADAEGSATFSNMRMSGQSDASGTVAPMAEGSGVQAATVDIAPKQIKIPTAAIAGLSFAFLILVAFIIGGIYLFNSFGSPSGGDDLPTSTATKQQYTAERQARTERYQALEGVPDGVRVASIRNGIDAEFAKAQRLSDEGKYDNALQALGVIQKRITELETITIQHQRFEQKYKELEPLVQAANRYSASAFADATFKKARKSNFDIDIYRDKQEYAKANAQIDKAKELYLQAIQEAIQATSP